MSDDYEGIEEPVGFVSGILTEYRDKRLREVEELDAHIQKLPTDKSPLIVVAFGALDSLRQSILTEAFGISRQLGELKLRAMLLKERKKGTIEVLKDLFGILSEEQADKLEKAIVDLRASMRRE